MSDTFIVIAGATGDLGGRIAASLIRRGATVRALVRAQSSRADIERLTKMGVTTIAVDLDDVDAVTDAVHGASCVVSAMSGLRDVILDRQSVLLDAAARAGVPRFIPSDYSSDYTTIEPGLNRNFDFRREFAGRADRAPIAVTSIFNGAFMDMLGSEMPIIQPRIRSVLFWQSRRQKLDFTTRADTAEFTAAAALDSDTPRILRIVGDSLSAADLSRIMSRASGQNYRTIWVGTTASLGVLISLLKHLAPNKPDAVFPIWQGMQYTRDMFSGKAKVEPRDNARYPDIHFTTVEERFANGHLPTA